MTARTRAFLDVDAHPDPPSLLSHLDRVETLRPQIEVRQRTYQSVPGGAGIDVGCGHGRVVAELVERGVPAIGVDRSTVMVQAARRRFPSCTFIAADATSLPFPDGAMHWYRAERTYLHIPEQSAALAEARRVVAPGGTIVVADPDFDSTVITSAYPELTRKIVNAFTDDLPHGRAGSRMPALLARAGFTDVTVSIHPMVFRDFAVAEPSIPGPASALARDHGLLSAEQVEAWMADLRDRGRDSGFLLAYMTFISTARVPGSHQHVVV